jgi:hypothetical protein
MLHMTRKMQNMTHAQELVTLRTGRDVPDLLRELYVTEGTIPGRHRRDPRRQPEHGRHVAP